MVHQLLIVNGSPKPDGNSSRIEKKVIQKCVAEEFHISCLNINQYANLHFDGSSSMFKENRISNKYIKEIVTLLLSADSIIVISPVYLHHIPAAFKNIFLVWLTVLPYIISFFQQLSILIQMVSYKLVLISKRFLIIWELHLLKGY